MERIKPVTRLINFRLPPSGFILQKDVYTTNLLYANDQLPPDQKNKWFSFRSVPNQKPNNPSKSIKVYKETEASKTKYIEKSEIKDISSPKNSRKLKRSKLSFPLPKITIPPLTTVNYNKNLCRRDLNIKFMDDDLNIASRKAKKIFYNYKKNEITSDNCKTDNNFCDIDFSNQSLSTFSGDEKNKTCKKVGDGNILKPMGVRRVKLSKHRGGSESMHFIYKPFIEKRIKNIKFAIGLINTNMKRIQTQDREYRKIFFKDEMFPTQIKTQYNNNSFKRKKINI